MAMWETSYTSLKINWRTKLVTYYLYYGDLGIGHLATAYTWATAYTSYHFIDYPFQFICLPLTLNPSITLFLLRDDVDNIGGVSFSSHLCSPSPIDVVYTWVNGSDPFHQRSLELWRNDGKERLRAKSSNANKNITCPDGAECMKVIVTRRCWCCCGW